MSRQTTFAKVVRDTLRLAKKRMVWGKTRSGKTEFLTKLNQMKEKQK